MKPIQLTQLLEQEAQSLYYDINRDFLVFQRTIDATTEQAKSKIEKAIGDKILNKKIKLRASKGYKQPTKDFEIGNVISVSIDNYYDSWVIIVRDSNKKEYFVKPGFKIQILGPGENEQTPQNEPSQEEPETNEKPAVPGKPPVPQQPAQKINKPAVQPPVNPNIPQKPPQT